MAQVRLLKIVAGVPTENASADDITFNSFTAGAGPVMSPTGIDMNGQDIVDLSDLVFTDPAVGTINQTAGALIVDNIMAKERNNIMTTAGAVLFPTVTDTAGQLDSMKIPDIAAVPTATPAFSADAGYMVFDSVGKNLYVWDGAAWQNQTSVAYTGAVVNSYVAGEDIDVTEAVYISAADEVSLADANGLVTSSVMGFAYESVLDTNPILIISEGVLAGFTGLTAGARYFLSETAGAITATPPTTSGAVVNMVGYAKSTTALKIQFQYMATRA